MANDGEHVKHCGDFGGIAADGQPCGRRVIEGRCPKHTEENLEAQVDAKAQFLELFRTGQISLKRAGAVVGVAPNTIWRWRQADPEFDKAVGELQQVVDDIRLAMVEDATFERIIGERASAAEVIFYLINRSKGRWRDVRHVRLAGPDGGPVRTENYEFDPSDFTTAELERIAAGESWLKVLAERPTKTPAAPA